jgi:hypothetical protein
LRVPKAFDGFTILQLSDLHVEMSEGVIMRLATRAVPGSAVCGNKLLAPPK